MESCGASTLRPENIDVAVRTICPVEAAEHPWLLKSSKSFPKRREDERFRKLSRIMAAVRDDLMITKSKHVDFWPGVKRIMEQFLIACPEAENSISYNNSLHRDAVAELFRISVKNHVGRENKKAKLAIGEASCGVSENCGDRLVQKGSGTDTNRMDVTAAVEHKGSAALPAGERAPNPASPSARLDFAGMCPSKARSFQTGEIVALIDRATVVAVGGIISPSVTTDEGDYDFTKVKLRIMVRFGEKHALDRGSISIVPVRSLSLLPTSRIDLYKEFMQEKGKCSRGEDCMLGPDVNVILDLDDEHLEFWPLVAKVKSVQHTKNKREAKMIVLWYEGYSDDPAPNGRLMDGKWRFWQNNGKVKEDVYPVSRHFFCGFEITRANELPLEAKEACQERVEFCAHLNL